MKFFHRISQTVNLRLLAGALTMALVLWLYVKLGADYVYQVTIPLQVTNIRSDRALSRELPRTITVRLQGPGSSLAAIGLLGGGDLHFALDLNTINREWACPTADYAHWITLPQGFTDIETEILEPDTIRVVLEPALTRRLPVLSAAITVTPEAGYIQVGPVRFTPDSLTLRGPRSMMRSLTRLLTDSLDVQESTEPFTEPVTLLAPVSSLIALEQREVQAYFDIQKLGERTLGNIPVTVTGVPRGRQTRTEPETVDLIIRGGVDYIRQLDPADIRATIPWQTHWERYHEYRTGLRIAHPADIIAVIESPRIFTVIVP